MPPITIYDPHGPAEATILPEVGFNCFRYETEILGQRVSVLDAMPGFAEGSAKPSGSGIPILFPFPNRIRAGKFEWAGRTYEIPGTDKWGNAIHGFVLNRPWRVIDQARDFVTAQFQLSVDAPDRLAQWPCDFQLEVRYELYLGRLRAHFTVTNPGTEDLPWGLGTHPYIKLPLATGSSADDCTVEVPADRRWELVDCLPTGQQLELDDAYDLRDGATCSKLSLDDVYTQLRVDGPQFDCVLIDARAGYQVTLTAPPIFREIVMFTPPSRGAICIEPYTCVTDAINLEAQGLDAGLRVLAPGSEFCTWLDLAAGPVLA